MKWDYEKLRAEMHKWSPDEFAQMRKLVRDWEIESQAPHLPKLAVNLAGIWAMDCSLLFILAIAHSRGIEGLAFFDIIVAVFISLSAILFFHGLGLFLSYRKMTRITSSLKDALVEWDARESQQQSSKAVGQ